MLAIRAASGANSNSAGVTSLTFLSVVCMSNDELHLLKHYSQNEQDDVGIDSQDADRTCHRLMVSRKDKHVCFARYLGRQDDGY